MSTTAPGSNIDLAAIIVKTLVECGVSAKDLPDAMLGVWKMAEAAEMSADDAARMIGKAITEFGHSPMYIESTIKWLNDINAAGHMLGIR